MRVVTDNPVIVDDAYSNAKGDGKKRRQEKRRKRQQGLGESGQTNKEFRQSQKESRKGLKGLSKEEKKAGRKAMRSERKSRRKARRNARKLRMDKNKDGKVTFKDLLHPLKREKNPNTGQANWTKTNPDGTKEIVPDERVEEVKGNGGTKVPVDGNDLKGVDNAQANPDGTVTTETPPERVEEVDFDDGSTGYVRKDDIDDDGKMSKGLKIGLIVGGVVVLAVATILIVKAVKKGKAKGKK